MATLIGVQNPHFDLPFRFKGSTGNAVVVEQDSFDDVANCVEAICRTPYGFREDSPTFGFPQVELTNQPVISADVESIVAAQEPRASLMFSEVPGSVDVFTALVTILVTQLTGTTT